MLEINKKLPNKKGSSPKVPAGQNHKAKPKLLEQVRTKLRVNHYSRKSEEAYIGWIKRFILFHNKRHLLGHSLVKTLMIYTHFLNIGGVNSPLD